MHADLLHPSRFLKSAEFKGEDVTLTIADVVLEELEREDNSKEMKGIVSFKESPKLLVLNRTNSDCLKAMFGPETEIWKGKRVTFFPSPMVNPFTKENISAIRLRGSPDLSAPVSVSIKLRKRKASVMTMKRTGSQFLTQEDFEAICIDITTHTDPAAMDAAWSTGLATRIGKQPPDKQVEAKKLFSAHKSKLQRAAKEAKEAPPPAEVTKFEKPEPPPSEPF